MVETDCKGVWKTCYNDRTVLYHDCGIGKQHICQNSLIKVVNFTDYKLYMNNMTSKQWI